MKKVKDADIADLLSIDDYIPNKDCFLRKDGTFLDMYQINTKDLTTSNVDDITMDCFKWTKFYRLYAPDIKFVFMKFPCNTSRQQQYWESRIERNKNPLFKDMLKQKYDELVYRAKHASSMEFYMFLFVEPEKLDEARAQVNSTLQIGQHGLVKGISRQKKEKILFKLANKCSLIFPEQEEQK